jgi:hypothetical protein
VTTLVLICLLSSGTYQQRQDAIHALKIAPASFEQLAVLYSGVNPQQWPELSGNLKEVLWQKWRNEKETFYFPLDEYIYDSEVEKLRGMMQADFERALK